MAQLTVINGMTSFHIIPITSWIYIMKQAQKLSVSWAIILYIITISRHFPIISH